ncbi:MAG TPA: SDR family NAD(P)-dependent oxidoreductase, partial [Gammaproteobacteria bacterium]|nr:SDR family NAD(P)-dependent oxidoreductase [Gammaproteobacteria bacterium]
NFSTKNLQPAQHFVPNQKLLKNKIILLVGATGGIGQSVAKALAKEQAELILIGRQKKTLESLYDEIVSLGLPEPALYPCDLMNLGIEEASVIREHIAKLYGRLDGYIHCAGAWGTFTPIEYYPEKQWLQVMHLNLNVPFLLIKNMLPLLKLSPLSSIILTESPLSANTLPLHGAFNCSQYGLRALIAIVKQELQHVSVTITGINPECVSTPLRAKLYPAANDKGILPEQIAPYYVKLLQNPQLYHGKSLTIAELND